jgi:hypothetical protein
MSFGHGSRRKIDSNDCERNQKRNKLVAGCDCDRRDNNRLFDLFNIYETQMITIEQLKDRLQFITTRLNAKKVDFLVLGGKNLEGLMKARIFNDGLDSGERKIGKYKSKAWIAKRSENGRQTSNVDLEFTGELRDSIQVVRSKDKVFLVVVNDKDFAKAKGQEDRRKKKIFTPSRDERQQTEEYIADLFNEELTKIVKLL